MLKKISDIVLKIVSFAAIAAVIFGILNFKNPETIEDLERELSFYRKDFEIIIDFCQKIDFEKYSSASFWADASLYDEGEDYTLFPADENDSLKRLNFEDRKVARSFNKLFRKGYGTITCTKEGIEFQRMANRIQSIGIAYSFGNDIPYIDFLIRSEPMSEDRWYFYCTNSDTYKK